MAYSKISICNLALASVGEDSIRSFTENNKRARMTDVFFEPTRDYLLTKFDWPFARAFVKLNQLDIDEDLLPSGIYAYQLPSDCKTARDLHPLGSRDEWEQFGDRIHTPLSSDVYLYYTKTIEDTSIFSDTYANLLALALAVRLAPPITQDKSLTKALYEQFQREMLEVWESDANIGNSYREYNDNPIKDKFVDPDVI